MRILIAGSVMLLSLVTSELAFAQACPQGVVDVPRGRGATISIIRNGAEASLITVEWLRDGTGYFTKDSAQDVEAEQNKSLDYKMTNAAAFAPKANSELQVRLTGGFKDSGANKCMGEAIVQRMGDRTEVRFNATKGGAANTVVTVTYQAATAK